MNDRVPVLDRIVDAIAGLMTSLGLNGTRFRWRWQNRQRARAAAKADRSIRFRAVTGQHKMCPSCRSLIPRKVSVCPECASPVAHVSAPGPSRLLAHLLPSSAIATASIVTANAAIYVLMGAVAGFSASRGGGFASLLGLMGFRPEVLARFGWGYGPWILQYGELWRLITPLFIHAGLLHMFFNCYVLLQIGKVMEEEYGGAKLWVVYLVGGVGGGLASNFLRPALFLGNVPYVGASGAVLSIVGLAMAYGWRRGGPFGSHLVRTMGRWILYVLVFGFVVGADNFAHIGGLLTGGLLGLVVPAGRPRRDAGWWRLAAWAAAGVCLWAFAMAGLHGTAALTRFS
ncbi:MAG: rhomboid family intramembrane serine protease [Acidobacteriota bacterium]